MDCFTSCAPPAYVYFGMCWAYGATICSSARAIGGPQWSGACWLRWVAVSRGAHGVHVAMSTSHFRGARAGGPGSMPNTLFVWVRSHRRAAR